MSAAVTALLVAHLVCVNIAAGAPLVCVWLEWRGGDLALRAARSLGRWALATLPLGSLLGLAIGCLLWTPAYASLWQGPLHYKLIWAVPELVFSLFLAAGYWLLGRGHSAPSKARRLVRGSIALLSGTNLLYHFPPLFIIAGQLQANGATSGGEIRGAAFRQLMYSGSTPALMVHVLLASLALAGGVLIWTALRRRRKDNEEQAARLAVWGGRIALAASALQLPVGLWTLASLPAGSQSRLMGSDGLATVLFLGSMVLALWLLRELASIALGETTRATLVRAIAAMLIVVGLMTATQRQVPATREIRPYDRATQGTHPP
jgi:hypothetical protein